MADPTPTTPRPPADPLAAFRAALSRYPAADLAAIVERYGPIDRGPRAAALADALTARLGEPRAAENALSQLPRAARRALGLFALTESHDWPEAGLGLVLRALGDDPDEAIPPLLAVGLLARRPEPEPALLAHPEARAAARPIVPDGPELRRSGPPRQVREADGLEPIVRLAALWQRLAEAPLRQTQQGILYKRDRDRLEDDPVLAGPIADALEPLPDMARLWLALARGVGLVRDEEGSDRIVAAGADYWAENAVHLPQMLAVAWLGLRRWHEHGGMQENGAPALLTLPLLRPAALLWLATLDESEWVALEDLAEPFHDLLKPESPSLSELEALLLGAAYQLGLVRAAEEDPSGRRLVQLTPLGRYVLALGPPPSPRPIFDHFLFVQPNFEIVAYRQGLNPALIGQLSRFTTWSQIGAALQLRLTAESVYRGLEGGLTPESMLERLGRQSARALPAGIAEALRTWAGRRQRVTFHTAATLIEFASAETLEAALRGWPDDGPPPVRVSDRLLMVEEGAPIPFARFRLSGSRDYRRPPEPCIEVEPDGVTLAVDLGRSDLFIDAELSRLADPIPSGQPPRRRYRVTPGSLNRALDDGLTPAQLSRWFLQRTGAEVPAAVLLLLHAARRDALPMRANRPIVLQVPTSELLDGLLQHPATRDHFGDRLGPAAIVVPDAALEPLRRALAGLGLSLDDLTTPPKSRRGS